MKFQPTYQLNILPEDAYLDSIGGIEQQIQSYAVEGDFSGYQDCRLHYQYILCEQPKGSIIILHGFSEFYTKYYEMAWYYLNMGFQIFFFDLRGHGFSDHLIDNLKITHVDHFTDYAEDLDIFVHQIVMPLSENVPIHLFSHSMGGSAAFLYLGLKQNPIQSAVFCAPLIYPNTKKMPKLLVKLESRRQMKLNGPTGRFPYMALFNPDEEIRHVPNASYPRFSYLFELRKAQPLYQNSGASNQWLQETLRLEKQLLNPDFCKNITCPILLLSGTSDSVVSIGPHKKIVKLLPNASLITFENGCHSLYTSNQEQTEFFYQKVIEFFQNHS